MTRKNVRFRDIQTSDRYLHERMPFKQEFQWEGQTKWTATSAVIWWCFLIIAGLSWYYVASWLGVFQ